jgi:hypothetical protein
MKSSSEVKRVLSDIRSLKEQNKSDKEIRSILKLKIRMYQRYLKRVHKLDKQVWYDITHTQLETELTRLKQSFEHTYNVAMKMVNDRSVGNDDKVDWLHEKENAILQIRLLIDSPPIILKVQNSRAC